MNEKYEPPFNMSEEITNLIIEIGEYTGSIATYESLHPNPVLRRENRIKSIYSSLAIEANSLSLDQVTDVIQGKRVLGPPQDIQEAKNAYEAYNQVMKLNPYSVKDLLKAHKIMMSGLIRDAGTFRSKNVGVYTGTQLIHAGTPANYVPELMSQLFEWLKMTKYHPLVKSCIFHYEFEFIHPFSDGNGRTGRLWQTLILYKWKEFFAWLPVETLVHENQDEYYKAIQLSNNSGESTIFVEFMLRMIRDALKELSKNQQENDVVENVVKNVVENVGINIETTEEKLLKLLRQDGNLTGKILASSLGITVRQVQRMISKLKQQGKIVRHGSNRKGYWEVKDNAD